MELSPSKSEKKQLLSAISSLSDKIADAVEQAKQDFKTASDVYEFLSTKNVAAGIRKLFIMPLYIQCFNAMSVKTRAELEQLWAKHYSHHDVREAVKNLLENEGSMREFAEKVDKELILHEKHSNPPAKIGQALPNNLALTNAETGQATLLETCWSKSKFTWFVFLRHFG